MDKERLQEITLAFCKEFIEKEPVGVISGDIEFPVQLVSVGHTPASSAALKEFKCSPAESAILARWAPMRWEWANTFILNVLAKLNLHTLGVVPKNQWVRFPNHYLGVPVHYKRGGRIHYLGKK